jgi:hypothetical protein
LRRREREILGRIDRVSTEAPGSGERAGRDVFNGPFGSGPLNTCARLRGASRAQVVLLEEGCDEKSSPHKDYNVFSILAKHFLGRA